MSKVVHAGPHKKGLRHFVKMNVVGTRRKARLFNGYGGHGGYGGYTATAVASCGPTGYGAGVGYGGYGVGAGIIAIAILKQRRRSQ